MNSPIAQPTRGLQAIRAQQRAARARAQKPGTLTEAVSNDMDAVLADIEAKSLLQPPENLVTGCGETIQSDFRLPFVVDTLQQNPSMVNIIASEHRVDLAACVWSRVAESAIDAAQSAQAANSLEKMLCHQMAAMHCAAMKLIASSLRDPLPPVEKVRLSNAAARMMQVYQDAFLALQKIRSGGRQTLVVQHVQVTDGGQAVIAGNVKSRRERE
jgi:hypothetical protein